MLNKTKRNMNKIFRESLGLPKFKDIKLIPRSVAIGFIVASFAPILFSGSAAAYGQVQSRSIELSTSQTSATGVTYNVSFKPATAGNLGGIVVDFCANDPIIGDICTAPTGFTVGASPSVTITSGIATAGSWGATTNGAHNTLFETNATAQAVTGTSTPVIFTINNVQNPSTLGTFYARILTFDTQAHATAFTSGGAQPITGLVDAGGVAIATVQQIIITSKVQEVLTFCIYTSTFTVAGDCSGATGNTVTLGNNNGVLSTAGTYVDNSVKYDIQTNALNGGAIRFEGTVPTSGSNVIESSTLSGSGAAAATAYTTTCGTTCTPQFGLCTWSAQGTTANLVPQAPYNSGPCSGTTQTAGLNGGPGGDNGASFAFNIANASSTYGDVLANFIAGPYAQGRIALMGNISNTTVAGIYTNTLTFIATGVY